MPATRPGLMCRSLVSVGYDGKLYDCDFNQMLEMELEQHGGAPSVWDIGIVHGLGRTTDRHGAHCFGCTAGAGSSCTGALA